MDEFGNMVRWKGWKIFQNKVSRLKVILQDEYDVVYTIYLLNKFQFNLHDGLQSFLKKENGVA